MKSLSRGSVQSSKRSIAIRINQSPGGRIKQSLSSHYDKFNFPQYSIAKLTMDQEYYIQEIGKYSMNEYNQANFSITQLGISKQEFP